MAAVPSTPPGRPQNSRVSREPPPPAEPPPRRPRPARPSEPWSQRASRWSQQLSFVPVLVLLAGTVIAGRYGHRWLTHTPQLGARTLEVTGISHCSREEVLAAARLTVGSNVLAVDLERAARQIERLPWVARATVTRQLPDTLRVAIEERAPAALVAVGGLYLASADGTLFKRAEPGDPVDLPVVTGLSRESFRDRPDGAREQVRDSLALMGDLESAQLGSSSRLQEVHREPTGDLSVMLGGTYIWLGRGPYRSKLSRLRVVLGELRRHGLEASEVHLESDRHPERVTVRAHTASAAEAGTRRGS
ncbi:MAG: FtsQ-type POTRA domain-containing protein [Deltaproteobacteria bacterium]|nr:FtsQ-type POTRA domain-containing protein [Deltaproteobacteria bacterium]